MMAHSLIQQPTLTQETMQNMDAAVRTGWLRAPWGRRSGGGQQNRDAAAEEPDAPAEPDASAAPPPPPVPEPAAEGRAPTTLPVRIVQPLKQLAAPVIVEELAATPPDEPHHVEALAEPFCAELQPEPDVEPGTPRAGWCILEEPPTPDRCGRVRAGSSDDRGSGAAQPLILSSVPRSATVDAQYTTYTVQLCYPPSAQRGSLRGRAPATLRWSLERRYSEFAELHDSLATSLSGSDIELPPVPPSRWMGAMDPAFVDERRAALETWLASLLCDAQLAMQPQLHAFLETPDGMLISLGMCEPPTPIGRDEISPAVRGEELIQQQRQYLVTLPAELELPPPRGRAA